MSKVRIAIPEIDQKMENYTRAVFAAGMEPVVISVQREQTRNRFQQEYLDVAEFRIDAYDGLLIPGGGDIDPGRYGQENNGSVMIMEQLDELQLSMLDQFIQSKKPVLGICRGLQILNVYFGGTLVQHLPTAERHAPLPGEGDKVHPCQAEKGSWLAGLYGESFVHNSSHHQAVDRPGKGLLIDGICPQDGVVEALHHESLPVYGVQFHPERMCLAWERDDTADGILIFDYFYEVCHAGLDRRRRKESEYHAL